MGAEDTMIKSKKPVISICAVRTGCGKSQTTRRVAEILIERGQESRRHPAPDAVRRSARADLAALRRVRRHDQAQVHDRGDGGVRAAHRQRHRRLRRRRLRADPRGGREGGRRRPLGRRQQRRLVLRARPAHRRRRPAPRRPRADLLPGRAEPPHGGRGRHQQGGLGDAGGHRPAASKNIESVNADGQDHPRRLAGRVRRGRRSQG